MSTTMLDVELSTLSSSLSRPPASGDKEPDLVQPGEHESQSSSNGPDSPSRLQVVAIITILSGLSFLNTMGSGILTIALPRIAQDLSLPSNLLLWPASVYALTAGCTLLIFGSVADVIGPKKVWITGSFLYAVFTVACGFAQTGNQLIAFRTVLGAAVAMCLPTAVSLTTSVFERGLWRNIAFACVGMGQPLGYSIGLILGGVFTDTIGWRWGYA